MYRDMDATTLETLKAIGVRIDSIADDTTEIRVNTAETLTVVAGIRTDTARIRIDTAGVVTDTANIRQTIHSSQTGILKLPAFQWASTPLTLLVDENKQKILRWLSRTDPSSNHNEARKKHEPKTGDWLLQSETYNKWKTSPSSILWLYGKGASHNASAWLRARSLALLLTIFPLSGMRQVYTVVSTLNYLLATISYVSPAPQPLKTSSATQQISPP